MLLRKFLKRTEKQHFCPPAFSSSSPKRKRRALSILTKRHQLFIIPILVLFAFAAAQDVMVEDPVFNTPPLELGSSIPMGQRYTKKDFEAAAAPTTVTPLGRTQIMSNRPENVSEEGVLYRGTVEESGSVYFYHVNVSLEPRRFAALLHNPGDAPVTVTLTALGTAVRDEYGYRYGGQEVAYEVLSSLEPRTFKIPPGGWRWLEPDLPATPVDYKGGVSLQADFETSSPVEVRVVSLDEGTGDEGMGDVMNLPDVPADRTGAGRGTFPGAERRVDVTLELTGDNEPGFTLSPGSDWVFGTDEVLGAEAQNRGNYGMLYHVDTEVVNKTGGDRIVRFYAVNIGCVISGAVRLGDGPVFKLPTDMLGALDVNDHGTVIGQLALKVGETGTFRFDFTPPGFSCLPVGIVARAYEPETLKP